MFINFLCLCMSEKSLSFAFITMITWLRKGLLKFVVFFFQMSVNVSLSLESSNADEESKPGLSIFSFRQAHHCLKAYKIPSLSLGYRNFTMMWSDLFLFLEFCPPLSEPFQSENFFSSVKFFFLFLLS